MHQFRNGTVILLVVVLFSPVLVIAGQLPPAPIPINNDNSPLDNISLQFLSPSNMQLDTPNLPHRDDPQVIVEYGFEDGWEDWTHVDMTAGELRWHTTQVNAFQGSSWWCSDEDIGGYNNHWLQYLDTPAMDFSQFQDVQCEVTFQLLYEIEDPAGAENPYDGWDGCNLWVSTDGGENWEILQPAQPQYDCESLFSFGFEWGMGEGVPGWAGSSNGWVEATANLDRYNGQRDVRLRWAFCSDPSFCTEDDQNLIGMLVDNIVVTAGRDIVFSNDGNEDNMDLHQGPANGDFWELTAENAHDGDFCLHCPVEPMLDNIVQSPVIELPPEGIITLDFWIVCDMPAWDVDGDNVLDDYWQLHIKVGNGNWQNFIYDYLRRDEMAENWFHYIGGVWWGDPEWAANLDLSQFAGETIQLRWVMKTDDDMDGNQGTGFWLDDVRIVVEEEGEDWIVYDDGQPTALRTEEFYWVKTNFTAEEEFELQRIQILPLNQCANHEDPMLVMVYRLDQESLDFAELVYSTVIESVPDYPEWCEIDLGQNDVLFERGESFAILYDAPGGRYPGDQDGDGWWCLYDGRNDFDRSFFIITDNFGDDPSNAHEEWTELTGDLFIRAGGSFSEEFLDVAVLSISNANRLWNHLAETEILYEAEIENVGDDIEQCNVVFSVVTDEDEVIWENVVQVNNLAQGDQITVEAGEPWSPSMDEIGHFTVFVDCNIDNDARIENNRAGMSQNILDPTGEELFWQRFNNFNFEFRRFGNESNGWGVAFYHPGGDQPMTLGAISFGMYSEEETETNFSVHILDADLNISLVWEGHGMTTGAGGEWVDPVDFNFDPEITINAGEAFIITSYHINPEVQLLVDRDIPIDAMNDAMPGMTVFTPDGGNQWEWWDEGDFFIMAALAPSGVVEEPQVAIGERQVIGTTWYDYQANGTLSKTIARDRQNGTHFTWMNGLDAEMQTRHMCYNFIDEEGVLLIVPNDLNVVDAQERSGYGNLALLNNDVPVVFYHGGGARMAMDWDRGMGAFQEIQIPFDPADNFLFPHGTVNQNNNVHVIGSIDHADGALNELYYMRGEPVDELVDWDFTEQVPLGVSGCLAYTAAASPETECTALIYLKSAFDQEEVELWNNGAGQVNNDLFVVEAEDGVNFDFENPLNVTSVLRPNLDLEEDDPLFQGDTLRPYSHLDAVYDYNDVLHVAFVTVGMWEDTENMDPEAARVNSLRSCLWHWDNASEEIRLIAEAWYDAEAARPTWWTPNISCPSLGVDDDNTIYCIYSLYPEAGDIAQNGVSNFDVFATHSEDGGASWVEGVNITNTHAEGARAGMAQSEQYCSLAERVDQNLHIFYILDRDPGPIVFDGGGVPTLNQGMYHTVPVADLPQAPMVNPRAFHVGGDVPRLRHFVDFVETDINHSHLIQALTMDGEVLPTGWEMGVFTTDGLLAGASVWNAEDRAGVAAFGDDANTDEIEGFRNNEVVTFMLWDNETHCEYRGEPTFIQGPQSWQPNGFTVMTLSVVTDRDLVVPIPAGWNMISINVSPGEEMYLEGEDRGPDVVLMLRQLWEGEDYLFELFKDNQGRFYAPGWEFQNIPFWDLTNGYMIKALRDLEPVWTGEVIQADTDIPLYAGWNMIAYLPQYELDASDPDFYVLSPIIEHVEIAKDIRGRFLAPSWEFSSMLPWAETNGYLVKVDSDVILNYPQPERGVAAVGLEEDAGQEAVLTTRNMSLLVNNIHGIDVETGDRINVIATDGRIVGSGVVNEDGRCGLAVWGDDPLTDECEGLKDDEAFTLALVSAEDNSAHQLTVAQTLAGKGAKYINDDLTVLDMCLAAQIPETFYLAGAYPNPFNSTTRLSFGLPEQSSVRLAVYDMQGRLAASLLNDNLQAGVHSVIWQADVLAAGVYIVKMDAGAYHNSMKVVLMK